MERISFTKPKKVEKSILPEERIKAYSTISGSRTFVERAKIATMSNVREIGGNILEKADKPGDLPLALREYLILSHLQDTKVVPEITDIYPSQDGTAKFRMEKINNGATLEEWLQAYMASEISEDIIQEILEEVCESIGKIWQKGVVHCDLHTNNIVIGMEVGGEKMKPVVIDFGISKMPEKLFREIEEDIEVERDTQSKKQFRDEVALERQEMSSSQEFDFLRSYIVKIVGEGSPILETLDQLAIAADIVDNPY